MDTILPINALAAPRTLVLDPPMTDAEFEQFCRVNDLGKIERTSDGVIEMNAPAGFATGDGNAEIIAQLRNWWKTHKQGRTSDSATGFYLPDGSMLSPDAAYLTQPRLETITKADRRGFLHICPDFIIELLSETDRHLRVHSKMKQWIENGAQLGWLIDPYRQAVTIYTPEGHVTKSDIDKLEGAPPVTGFILNLEEVWSCY